MTAHGGGRAGSILAVRLDGMGDMLLAGPAIRALAAAGRGVTVLGDSRARCAGTGARSCPVPGHPCLDRITPAEVVCAVAALAGGTQASVAAAPELTA